MNLNKIHRHQHIVENKSRDGSQTHFHHKYKVGSLSLGSSFFFCNCICLCIPVAGKRLANAIVLTLQFLCKEPHIAKSHRGLFPFQTVFFCRLIFFSVAVIFRFVRKRVKKKVHIKIGELSFETRIENAVHTNCWKHWTINEMATERTNKPSFVCPTYSISLAQSGAIFDCYLLERTEIHKLFQMISLYIMQTAFDENMNQFNMYCI